MNNNSQKVKVIFFGNGLLADSALSVLEEKCDIIFHARTASDLATVETLKIAHPEAYGVLASFGVIIKPNFLKLFEPTGIINLHPSKLPKYRGPSPIESAILDGETDFSYSIMKLVAKMDAGPIYHRATLRNLPLEKTEIYQALATAGANYIADELSRAQTTHTQPFPAPTPQNDDQATYTKKLDKSMSKLHPEQHSASEILRQIIAFQNFPKPKYDFYGQTCIIHTAHIEINPGNKQSKPCHNDTENSIELTGKKLDNQIINQHPNILSLKCQDGNAVIIDTLQPAGKKVMSAQAFINGYGKK